MPKLKVEIQSVFRSCEDGYPRIVLKPNHDFNINNFTKIVELNNKEFELVSTKKENHEEDVFDYVFNQLITIPEFNENYIAKFLSQRFFSTPKSPKDMLIVNKEKKYVLLKLNSKEYRVECHKDDKFNWFIGFGLALSQCYGNQEKWKNAREYFRNPKTHKLDYKNYAQWCVFEYFENDTTKAKEIQTKVKEINEYGKVDL